MTRRKLVVVEMEQAAVRQAAAVRREPEDEPVDDPITFERLQSHHRNRGLSGRLRKLDRMLVEREGRLVNPHTPASVLPFVRGELGVLRECREALLRYRSEYRLGTSAVDMLRRVYASETVDAELREDLRLFLEGLEEPKNPQ